MVADKNGINKKEGVNSDCKYVMVCTGELGTRVAYGSSWFLPSTHADADYDSRAIGMTLEEARILMQDRKDVPGWRICELVPVKG